MDKNYRLIHILGAALILAASLIASAYLLSRFFVKVEKDKLLCVKGFAQEIVESDIGYFSFSIMTKSRTGPVDCYNSLNKSIATAIELLKKDGFKDSEITKSNMYSSQVYKIEKGKTTNDIFEYRMSQTVTVNSSNVDLIDKKHRNLNALLGKNIEIDIISPKYFISDLNKYKIKLLAKATANAKLRAQTIAENSGAHLGKVVWAQQGVIQITAPLSTETSDYGVYNTNAIRKAIKIVVTLKYTVEK